MGVAANHFGAGELPRHADASVALPHRRPAPRCSSGSCSAATRQQVARWRETGRAVRIDPLKGSDPAEIAKHVLDAVRDDVDAASDRC